MLETLVKSVIDPDPDDDDLNVPDGTSPDFEPAHLPPDELPDVPREPLTEWD